MPPKVDIGIDLGTTNCAVARIDPGGRASSLGPLPSVMAWSNDKAYFSPEARRMLSSSSETVFPIRDLKMRLEEGWLNIGTRSVDAVELASQLLSHISRQLVKDTPVGTAVIGTPVRVGRGHRLAVRRAAFKAGFQDVRFVYEPTAALIGALHEIDQDKGLVLVVDWGGGTLDVSVVRIEKGVFRELAVDGDISDLGGSRIDEAITSRLLRNNPDIDEYLGMVKGGFERLKEEVEAEKIEIVDSLDGESGPSATIVPHWLGASLELSPQLVFEVLRDHAARARQMIVQVLRKAGLKPEDLSHILFAGGVCRCPAVREEICRSFSNTRRVDSASPQLLTALGCARLAATGFKVELAADFVARQCDDSVCVLLPRGQSVDLNAFRRAEFLVTDVHAPEAIFDLGVCNFDEQRRSFLAADGASFRSIRQVFVRTGAPLTAGGVGQPELVRLHVGVDGQLSVAIHAESNRGNAIKQEFISGVPLAIRVDGTPR